MSEGRWVTLENDTKLFIGSGRTFRQALQDRLSYTGSPDEGLEDNLREGLQERLRENEYNEIKEKIENISKRSDFVKVMQEDLGVEKITITGFDKQAMQDIATEVNEFVYEFDAKGSINELKTTNKQVSVQAASAIIRLPRDGEEPVLILTVNKPDLGDSVQAKEFITRNSESGWYSGYQDTKGLIKHEMAHFIEYKHSMNTTRESQNISSVKGKKQLAELIRSRKETTSLVDKAFKNVGVEKTSANIEKYVSGYAKTNDSEIFAEAWASTKDNKVVGEIKRLIRERG